jgi:hypothetical protein
MKGFGWNTTIVPFVRSIPSPTPAVPKVMADPELRKRGVGSTEASLLRQGRGRRESLCAQSLFCAPVLLAPRETLKLSCATGPHRIAQGGLP